MSFIITFDVSQRLLDLPQILRFLSTCDSSTTMASGFCLDVPTVASLVSDPSDVIWAIREPHISVPVDELWRNTARRPQEKWIVPNCIGATDGNLLSGPPCSGGFGSSSNGGIFADCSVGQAGPTGTLSVPAPCPRPSAVGTSATLDEAFLMKTFFLNPYHRWVFNQGLSGAGRMAELLLEFINIACKSLLTQLTENIIRCRSS